MVSDLGVFSRVASRLKIMSAESSGPLRQVHGVRVRNGIA